YSKQIDDAGHRDPVRAGDHHRSRGRCRAIELGAEFDRFHVSDATACSESEAPEVTAAAARVRRRSRAPYSKSDRGAAATVELYRVGEQRGCVESPGVCPPGR